MYVTRMPGPGKRQPTIAMLLAARSRGEIKRWGAFLDSEGRHLRTDLVVAARRGGVAVPDAALAHDGKRLLRLCLARADAAQVRVNPVAVDESFVCANCSHPVPIGGRRPRDHCPRCLHGQHVDRVPGDRAANCGGELLPIGVEHPGKGWMILYRCAKCGESRRNRFLDDVADPDSEVLLRALVARGATGSVG